MDGIGSVIIDSVFTFGNFGFSWAALFDVIRSISFVGIIRSILEIASPKNKYL